MGEREKREREREIRKKIIFDSVIFKFDVKFEIFLDLFCVVF